SPGRPRRRAVVVSELDEIERQSAAAIAGASTLDELRQVETDTLGRRSRLAALNQRLGQLQPEERKTMGAAINATRSRLTEALGERRRQLEAGARHELLAADRLDLTEVAELHPPRRGHLNLVTQTRDA